MEGFNIVFNVFQICFDVLVIVYILKRTSEKNK